MTLPTSGPFNLGDVLTELRIPNPSRALPISLGDADVRALAEKPSGPVSMSDLRGKTSYVPMSGSIADANAFAIAGGSNRTEHVPVVFDFANGRAPFSFAWSHVSGVGTIPAIDSATASADFFVDRFAPAGTVYTQVVQCTITDALTNTLTRQCTVNLTLE